jgi:hypothetical protein
MLERLKTSDALARLGWKMATPIPNLQADSEFQNDPNNSKLPTEIQNSNLVLPSGIDLANEVLDLRDLTERYWRVIQAQHVRIARLESELCARNARR